MTIIIEMIYNLQILIRLLLFAIVLSSCVYTEYIEKFPKKPLDRIQFPHNYLSKTAYLPSSLSFASSSSSSSSYNTEVGVKAETLHRLPFSSSSALQSSLQIKSPKVVSNFYDKFYYDDASVVSSSGFTSLSSTVSSPSSSSSRLLLPRLKEHKIGNRNMNRNNRINEQIQSLHLQNNEHRHDVNKNLVQQPKHFLSYMKTYNSKEVDSMKFPIPSSSFSSNKPNFSVITNTSNQTISNYPQETVQQLQREEQPIHETDFITPISLPKKVNISESKNVDMESEIKGRWWLDTIAKLLHSHPLTLSGNSRTLQNPIIEIYTDSDKPSSTTMNSNMLPWNNIPGINYQNERQILTYMNREIHNNNYDNNNNNQDYPSVYGWKRQVPARMMHSTAWIEHHVRQRIQRYKQWLSPKQWKQFLTHDTVNTADTTISRINSPAKFNLALFEAAVVGVRRAVAECRYQFRHERWNCSQVPDDETALFGNILLKGIPQTAFVYSIINAGIVQSVAEACLNQIDNCPCNNRGRQEPYSDWQWQGCDHNIHYGRRFSRRLLDTMERGSHIRFEMNLHNNGVGRQLVIKNMERYCRCHGTSGSCTLRTCYRRTPRMRTLGNLLKHIYIHDLVQVKLNSDKFRSIRNLDRITQDKYISLFNNAKSSYLDKAVKFTPYKQTSNRYLPSTQLSIINNNNNYNRKSTRKIDNLTQPHSSQLVYYESINQMLFCDSHPFYHILGTKGRLCNSSLNGLNNCRHLCCGRGYITHHYYTMESCNCKFIWCCRVECQQCLVLKKVETCI
ncbi:unnamed protein product [Heterobilharzia americana]|nr:unnamed protein product [Heterobilharzia americana]